MNKLEPNNVLIVRIDKTNPENNIKFSTSYNQYKEEQTIVIRSEFYSELDLVQLTLEQFNKIYERLNKGKTMIKKLILFILLSIINVNSYAVTLTKLQYHGFTLYMDCKERSVRKFEYTIGKDTGNTQRQSSFHYDPSVSLSCQQKSIRPYGNEYDLGHMVAANSMDSNPISEYKSFSITNVLPQTKELNREAWYQTEKITECYRVISTLKVIGGSILGNDRSNDLFLDK